MKTVLVLAALVAIALGGAVPQHANIKTKPVNKDFVEKQKKVLSLFYNVEQINTKTEYYQVGSKYDVEGNTVNYSNKKAVEDFLYLYRSGMLPKYHTFSIFYDNLRVEAIALYKLFFFAKDFDTFYKTAAWARVYLNEGVFLYSFYTAVLHREDCTDIVLPAPYEVYPEMFTNMGQAYKIRRINQQGGINFPELASQFGIVKENEDFIFYANYSDSLTYPNDEQRISYFTEDIGFNSFYYYCHAESPFWMTKNSKKFGAAKERRGDSYFFFYQQLLARYYLERLSNGLGEIPSFSWFSPIKVGYYPMLSTWKYPFAQRSNNYIVHNENNFEAVRFLDIFEKTFFQYLQKGHFKAFNQEIDFHSADAMNFVGNYWQTNADLFGEEFTETFQRSYEVTARRVLGAAPAPFDKYNYMPSALDFYQTSLRDPAFYQLYSKIFDYMVQYKEYLKPYTQEDLHFVGVKINDVKLDKLATYFDLYDFDALNMVIKDNQKEFTQDFKIRQPRLNHKAFSVTVDVKSDVATDAVFKIWIGPKYDSNGFPVSIENNWQNFYELDWFSHKLAPGMNKIKRSSEDFSWFKEDSLPISEIQHLLDEGKLPVDMSENYGSMPERLMLPKGTKGGMPYQIFVYVYKYNSVSEDVSVSFDYTTELLDGKPYGFPLDRPAHSNFFKQPNMFFEDVLVYHEGEEHTYKLANPAYKVKEL